MASFLPPPAGHGRRRHRQGLCADLRPSRNRCCSSPVSRIAPHHRTLKNTLRAVLGSPQTSSWNREAPSTSSTLPALRPGRPPARPPAVGPVGVLGPKGVLPDPVLIVDPPLFSLVFPRCGGHAPCHSCVDGNLGAARPRTRALKHDRRLARSHVMASGLAALVLALAPTADVLSLVAARRPAALGAGRRRRGGDPQILGVRKTRNPAVTTADSESQSAAREPAPGSCPKTRGMATRAARGSRSTRRDRGRSGGANTVALALIPSARSQWRAARLGLLGSSRFHCPIGHRRAPGWPCARARRFQAKRAFSASWAEGPTPLRVRHTRPRLRVP